MCENWCLSFVHESKYWSLCFSFFLGKSRPDVSDLMDEKVGEQRQRGANLNTTGGGGLQRQARCTLRTKGSFLKGSLRTRLVLRTKVDKGEQ